MEKKLAKINYKKLIVEMVVLLLFIVGCYMVDSLSGSKLYLSAEEDESVSAELFSDSDWELLDSKIYGTQEVEKVKDAEEHLDDEELEEVETVSVVEAAMWLPFCNGAFILWRWFTRWNIDISIDGLIYGRLSESYAGVADFVHFGLEANNPYGVAGSVMYYSLRRVLLGLLPIFAIILLIVQFLNNGSKGRARLKEITQNLAFAILLLFAMPHLLNLFIYVRDGVIWVVNSLMGGLYDSMGIGDFNFGNSVLAFLLKRAISNPSFINSMLFIAAVGAGVFFFAYYVTVAGLLTICFGILPLILFLSIWNRRILTEWWNVFFPNLLVPLIDLLLIQIPSIVYAVYVAAFGSDGNLVLCILILILIFNMAKIRAQVMKLLGFTGILGGSGAGVMGLVMLAGRLAMSAKSGHGGGGQGTGASPVSAPDAEQAAGVMQERGALMASADRSIKELPEFTEENYGLAGRDSLSETDKLLAEMSERYDTEGLGDGVSLAEGATALNAPDMDALNETGVDTAALDMQRVESLEDILPTMQEMPGEAMPERITTEIAGADAVAPMPESEMGQGVSMGDVLPEKITSRGDALLHEPKPVLDESFLGDVRIADRDKARYDNLARMDACQKRIQENEITMGNAGYNPQTYQENMARYNDTIKELNARIDSTEHRRELITDKTSAEYKTVEKDLTRLYGARDESLANQNRLKQGAAAARENVALRQRAEQYRDREKQYAYNSGLGGMSDKSYSSADTFKHDKRVEMIKKQHADYKNFDSRQYEGVLSPQERENFYRTRAIKEKEERIRNVARKAVAGSVGAAVAVPAMAFSAYGGPAAMMGAAVVSAKAGSLVGSGVDTVIKEQLDRQQDYDRQNRQKIQNSRTLREPVSGFDNVSRNVQMRAARQALQVNNLQLEKDKRLHMVSEDMMQRSSNAERKL